MFRRLKLSSVLLVWLLATGTNWDLGQFVNWGHMFTHYSQTMPLAEAVRMTFTPSNLCSVDEVMREAKQAENSATPSAAKVDSKVLLVFQPVPAVIFRLPSFEKWSPSDFSVPDALRSAPPLPPPRSVVA